VRFSTSDARVKNGQLNMSEMQPQPADSTPRSSDAAPIRPEELPPVEPPSSGYIVQLFLIPALIVAAVVAVWALFGKLADSGDNWQQMVVDLGSGNEHRRGRAAHGLSQLLRNEEIAPPKDRTPLAQQPEVVDSLTQLLDESLKSVSQAPADLQHQSFLARTVGSLDADDKTLPVLAKALQPDVNSDVRQSALMSVAMIAGRKLEQRTGYAERRDSGEASEPNLPEPVTEPTIKNEEIWQGLLTASRDNESVVRHLAAFAIGNVGGPEALDQLRSLLYDNDPRTRANAALGLTRNGSVDGLPVVIDLLREATKPWDARPSKGMSEEQAAAEMAFHTVEQPQIVRNCLRAVFDLQTRMTDEQLREVREIITTLAESYHTPDVRSQAGSLLKELGTEA